MTEFTTEQKKILIAHHGSVPGGAPTSLKNLIVALKKGGGDFDLTVCCPFKAMRSYFQTHADVAVDASPMPCKISGKVFIGWAKLNKLKNVGYFFGELFRSPLIILREFRYLRKKKPDIVHLNSAILWSTAIAAKLAGVKIVWHIRETFLGGRHNFRKRAYAFFLKKTADAVICISPTEAASIDGEKDPHVTVVYNSIDLSLFREELYNASDEKRKWGVPHDRFVILSLGGVSFRKGAFQLLQAVERLGPDYHLVIAGECEISGAKTDRSMSKLLLGLEDGLVKKGLKAYYSWSYPERLETTLQQMDTSRVQFTGVTDDVAAMISVCDVLVFSGVTPHFARPVFEAWAMKKPVIVFDTLAMRAEVTDGVDGIVVRAHTGQSLAEAIAGLRESGGAARKMGEAGYPNALGKFDMHANAEMVKRVYEDLTQ